jgi:hypothetical protein
VNRFTLQLGSKAEIEQAHRDFAAAGDSMGITELGKLEANGDQPHFIFSDLDKNWWELTSGF